MKKLFEFPYSNKLSKQFLKKASQFLFYVNLAKSKLSDSLVKKTIVPSLTGIPLERGKETLSFITNEKSFKNFFLLGKRKLKGEEEYFFIGYSYVKIMNLYLFQKKPLDVWKISNTFLHYNYIGKGFGSKIYDHYITTMELPLLCDYSLSKGAIKLWQKIISNKKKYTTFIYNFSDETILPSSIMKDFYLPDGSFLFENQKVSILAVKKGSDVENYIQKIIKEENDRRNP